MREIKFKFLMENREITSPYYLKELIDSDSYINIECEYSSKIKQELQYTGLKDKNGVEIYEGDVLEAFDILGEREIYPVIFIDGAFMGKRLDDEEFPYFYLFANKSLSETYRVIGNIHENKDLLEQI